MRLVAVTLLTLASASLLAAQQKAAPASDAQPAAQSTAATATPAPRGSQAASSDSPVSPNAFRRQEVVIQTTPLHVPIMVQAPSRQSPSAAGQGAAQQPSLTPTSSSSEQKPVTSEPPATPSAAAPPPGSETAPGPASPPEQTPEPAESPGQPPPEPGAAPPPLAPGSAILPTVTKKERREAQRQFRAGVKLKDKGDLDQAFTKFTSAAELDPYSVDYVTAREFTRQQLAYEALQRGNKAMLEDNEIVAMAEFRRALEYDPSNDYAMQRLRDAIPAGQGTELPVSVVEQSTPIELRPSSGNHDFHFRGDSHVLLSDVTRAYGIKAQFDESVQQKRLHFDIQNVNFATAMQAAAAVTDTFWVALTPTQVYFLADNVENRRKFERQGLRTFYLPELSDQELAEMMNSLRVLLNLRFISMDKAQNTISIRAEFPLLDAADKLIRSLTTGRPEVLLDMSIYAVSTSLSRSLGTALPTQFTMFNIGPALLAGLGPNATNLINQLIASGGINGANSAAISALLAQLQNSATSSVLSQPFVTFGGGLTLFGLTSGGTGITPTFSLNTSDIKILEHLTLRASHNNPAVAKIGERYPIVNATFAPIYNTPAIASVIGNGSYIAPIPSFTFEDLGLNLKATPVVHDNHDVTLKMELQLRSLGTQNVNGIPIVNNREYTGVITVKNGESSVVTGLIDMNDTRSINGYPFLGRIPGLGYGASVHNKNVSEDELLVVITPHILRLPDENAFAVELPPAH